MVWEKKTIITDEGVNVEAVAPKIISASRSTDIPAFYSKWFFNRLNRGYIAWKNPFNQQIQYVSLEDVRFIVFWTKNPQPIIPYLQKLDDNGIGYYFQFTLNDYETEGLEPNVPPLDKRIDTFIWLSEKIGKDRAIWRFDPLLLSEHLSVDFLLERIESLGNKLSDYTEKLVFSFADIRTYRKVTNNLNKTDSNYREFRVDEMMKLAKKLSLLGRKWRIELATCAESIDLKSFGIRQNRCIDDELIVRISRDDSKLMKWLGVDVEEIPLFRDQYSANTKLKDKGQRKECGCIISKDIGMYNTCNHLCTYCYANNSVQLVKKNREKHNDESDSII